MNTLPSEILLNVLYRLSSQRDIANCLGVCQKWQSLLCAPLIYSTIELNSSSQATKFFHFAKTKIINGTPVGHFVHCLKLHTNNIPKEILDTLSDTLPNIQKVIELTKDRYQRVQLQKKLNTAALTHFYDWNTRHDSQWMQYIDHNKVVLLQFTVNENSVLSTNQLSPSLPLSHRQFGLRQDANGKRIPLRKRGVPPPPTLLIEGGFIHHYGKVLVLPYLSRLTALSIIFKSLQRWDTIDYDIDERTLESIHQSCPSLESLQLVYLEMNISDAFETSLIPSFSPSSSSGIQPMTSLKTLDIYGNLYDARCCYYLSLKFPQLEEFILNLKFPDANSRKVKQHHQDGFYDLFYISIHNMMTSFKHLKKLEFDTKAFLMPFEYSYFTPSVSTFLTNNGWTHPDVISWLLSSPINFSTNITHLNFPLNMMINKNEYKINKITEHNFYSDIINNDYMNHSLFYINLNCYLNDLTSLSINMDLCTNEIYNFLTQNGKKPIVSSILVELKMVYKMHFLELDYDQNDKKTELRTKDDLYIYDWLTMFPRLKVFNLRSSLLIKDGAKSYDKKDNESLSDMQRQQDNIHYTTQSYPLQELIIHGGGVYFKNGFSAFCRSCPRLKRIDLNNIYYALPHWGEQDILQLTHTNQNNGEIKQEKELNVDMLFNLSHLRLDYLSLCKIRYISWIQFDCTKQPIVTTLILSETACNSNKNKEKTIYSDQHYINYYPPQLPMKIEHHSTYGTLSSNQNFIFSESQPLNQFCLRVICQSVDNLIFNIK
ncbi:hypothetical protein BJ944DRAFT_229911 [Cunninghamella echinulata]|nr:hypothetical protein BJ944DRAFT_229911 [Cunninghamella echinulata]